MLTACAPEEKPKHGLKFHGTIRAGVAQLTNHLKSGYSHSDTVTDTGKITDLFRIFDPILLLSEFHLSGS